MKWFLWISGVCWLLSLLHIVLRLKFSHSLHHGLPYDIYTRRPFEDTLEIVPRLKIVHEQSFFTGDWQWYYPAPGIFAYLFLGVFGSAVTRPAYIGSVIALAALAAIGIFVLARRLHGALQRRGLGSAQATVFLFLSACFAYPIFYALHQANLEAVIWVTIAIAVWAIFREKWWLAAVLLGVFGSMKIYPLLFLAMFLTARKYRQLIASVAIAILVTLASLKFFGPTLGTAFQRTSTGVHKFTEIGLLWGVPATSVPFDHSLPGLMHFVLKGSPGLLMLVMRHYMLGAGIVMTALYLGRMWRMPRVNQVFFLSLAAVTIPPVSFDYTLQLLYVPWAWLLLLVVRNWQAGQKVRELLFAMVGMALLLSPEIFIHIRGEDHYGQFKAVVLLAMLALSLAYPFDHEPGQRAAQVSQ